MKPFFNWMESNFGGNAAKFSTSWAGLTHSSLSDIKEQSLRLLSQGTFDVLQPYVANLVSTLSSPETMSTLENAGKQIGTQIMTGISTIKATVANLGLTDEFTSLMKEAKISLPSISVAVIEIAKQFSLAGIAFVGFGKNITLIVDAVGATLKLLADWIKNTFWRTATVANKYRAGATDCGGGG